MEFWGVEVKPGQTLPCIPGEEKYIHLSQIAIGENAEAKQRVPVYVHFDGKKIMLGTFNVGTCDQIGLDLVFEKDFQVSHGSKAASVFCSGYTTFIQDEEFGGLSDEDSEDEEEMMRAAFPRIENGGKPAVTAVKEAKDAVAKPGKPSKEGLKGKPELPKPSKKDEKDEDSDEDEEDEDSDEDEEMEDASGSDEEDEDDDDEEDDEDDDEEEEEETPKASAGKKRPVPASVIKTPGTEKKAKLATPQGQKPGEAKKNAHVATPHPGAKQGGRKGKETPGGSKQQTPSKDTPKTPKSNATPASGKKLGQYNCTTCQRNFNSESALSSHNTAKHSAGK